MVREYMVYCDGHLEIQIPLQKNQLIKEKSSLLWSVYQNHPKNSDELNKQLNISRKKINQVGLGCNYILK